MQRSYTLVVLILVLLVAIAGLYRTRRVLFKPWMVWGLIGIDVLWLCGQSFVMFTRPLWNGWEATKVLVDVGLFMLFAPLLYLIGTRLPGTNNRRGRVITICFVVAWIVAFFLWTYIKLLDVDWGPLDHVR